MHETISPSILDMQQSVLADPKKGDELLTNFAIGSAILNWSEVDLIQQWIATAQGEDEKITVND